MIVVSDLYGNRPLPAAGQHDPPLSGGGDLSHPTARRWAIRSRWRNPWSGGCAGWSCGLDPDGETSRLTLEPRSLKARFIGVS
jgi:hypothetical protein